MLRHPLISTLIHRRAQRLSRFEMGYPLLWNIHDFPTARIAAHSWRTVHDRKAAEPPDLNTVSAHHRVIHGIQNGRDGEISVTLRQLTESGGEKFDKV